MKTPLLLLLCLPIFSLGQQLPSIPFQTALDQAAREKKVIMALLYAQDCLQCNEVADKGLTSDVVKAKLNQGAFILSAYPTSHKDRKSIAARYNIPDQAIALLFISADGRLINKMMGSTSFGQTYVAQMEKSLRNAQDLSGMDAFEKAYASGSRNPALLAQLLTYRDQLDLDTYDLMNDYARSLSEDSLNSITQLQALMKHAPVLRSPADSIMRKNSDRFNEAWYRMSYQERSAINGRIVQKTKTRAIQQKDINLIYRTTSYVRMINNDPFKGGRNASWILMDYFISTKDTSRYFEIATLTMENIFMRIKPDSIKREDSVNRQKIFSSMKPSGAGTATIAYSPIMQTYANDMNQVAFTVYKMTDSLPLLKQATKWSRHSLEFFESGASLDTYARLLYKTGQKDSAIVYQRKAIEDAKTKRYSATEFERVLQKMIAGEMKID